MRCGAVPPPARPLLGARPHHTTARQRQRPHDGPPFLLHRSLRSAVEPFGLGPPGFCLQGKKHVLSHHLTEIAGPVFYAITVLSISWEHYSITISKLIGRCTSILFIYFTPGGRDAPRMGMHGSKKQAARLVNYRCIILFVVILDTIIASRT